MKNKIKFSPPIVFTAFILMWTAFLLGCPKANLDTYQKRSSQFATATNAGVNLTRELFQSQTISLEQKDKIADGFILLATGGESVDILIKEIADTYPSGVPKDKIADVVKLFRSNIIDRFLGVLESLRLFNLSQEYRTIITAIKTTVLLLAGVLNISKEAELKLAEVN